MPYDPKQEVFVTKQKLVEMDAFSSHTFDRFLEKYPLVRGLTGYPVFKLIKNLQYDRSKAIQVKTNYENKQRMAKIDDPSFDLSRAKAIEEVQKLRIANQQKMGTLISRDRAKNRVLTLLNAFATKLRYSIKNTAAQVAGLHDARQIEKIMTQNYNDVIDMLEREATILSWSEDEINSQLGRTELPTDTGEDTGNGGGEETEITSQE